MTTLIILITFILFALITISSIKQSKQNKKNYLDIYKNMELTEEKYWRQAELENQLNRILELKSQIN